MPPPRPPVELERPRPGRDRNAPSIRRRCRVPTVLLGGWVAGCVTASVESRPIVPNELTKPRADQVIEGVVFYQPRPYLLVYEFTQFDSSTPKSPRSSSAAAADSGKCARAIQKTELQILPDFAHPRVLVAKRHGIGTVKLTVNLSNGMITSVNSDAASTLTDALKAVTASAGDVSQMLRGPLLVPAPPRCNASPVLGMIVPVDWTAVPIVPMEGGERKAPGSGAP